MKKKISFNVSLDYQFFNGAPDTERLTNGLQDSIARAVSLGALNVAKTYNVEGVSVAPLVEANSALEVDTVLCVFDEITSLAHLTDVKTDNPYFDAMVADLKETHDNGGTPELRRLAMKLGAIIQNVWDDLTTLGLNEKLDGCFDFYFIPQVMRTVHTNHSEFPDAQSNGAWLNAALEVLQIPRDEYDIKKLAYINPEFALNLRAAANNFKAALDIVGAEKLSEFTGQSSGSILDELASLASKFTA
jgi:hypothetical protein